MHSDREACYAAMLARDPATDGTFFTCVKTTGIFCRNVCPARPPYLKNCVFVATAADAVAAGFRACKRCRPESVPGSPAWIGSASSVSRALKLIQDGALDAENEGRGEVLGDKLGLGERQVRRLFKRHLGASPVAVAQAKRLAAAAQLLDSSTLPMAAVALAAGFGSVRRFNEVFAKIHGETPAARRRRSREGTIMHLILSTYASPVGDLLVVSDSDGALRALDFADYEARMRTLLGRHYGAFELADGPVPPAIDDALHAYFSGDLTALDALTVRTGGSDFQRGVWAALRRIPAGTTTGYGALAAALGKPGGGARGRAGQRLQPDRHRRAVPPRHRRERCADRLRGRGGAQEMAAGARGRAAKSVDDLIN